MSDLVDAGYSALGKNVNIDCHAPILQALMLIYFSERTDSFMPLFLYMSDY